MKSKKEAVNQQKQTVKGYKVFLPDFKAKENNFQYSEKLPNNIILPKEFTV